MLAPFTPELEKLHKHAEQMRAQCVAFGSSLIPMLGFNVGDVVDGLRVSRVYFDFNCYQRGRDWQPGFRVIGQRGGGWDSFVLDIAGNRVRFGE